MLAESFTPVTKNVNLAAAERWLSGSVLGIWFHSLSLLFFFAPYLNMSEPDTAGLNCSETLVIQSLSKHMDNGADLMDRGSADLPVPTVTVVRGSMKDTCLFWV